MRGRLAKQGRGFLAGGSHVGRRQVGSWPVVEGRTTLEHPFLKLGRKAPRRLAQPPLKELDHALGKGEFTLRVERVLRGQIVGNQKQGHVAHNL